MSAIEEMKPTWTFVSRTDCLRNDGTSGRIAILYVKISRKRRITFFRLRYRFREK